MEDPEGEESGHNTGGFIRHPEKREANGQLNAGIEITEIENIVRYEASLDDAEQGTTSEEGRTATKKTLEASDDGPGDHLNGYPSIWTKFLRNELRGELGEQEADVEYRLAGIVIVCVHPQVRQHVVRQRLDDVAAVELEGEEHETHPRANA